MCGGADSCLFIIYISSLSIVSDEMYYERVKRGKHMRAAIIEDMNGYGIVNYIQAISQEGLDVVLTMDPE